MGIRSYADLVVWQEAMKLTAEVYRAARLLPPAERFELGAQLRRSAVSVPANIAEGYGRLSRGDYLRFLRIANGSLKELETLIRVCVMVGALSSGDAARARRHCDDVGRLLRRLVRRLESLPLPGPPSPTADCQLPTSAVDTSLPPD